MLFVNIYDHDATYENFLKRSWKARPINFFLEALTTRYHLIGGVFPVFRPGLLKRDCRQCPPTNELTLFHSSSVSRHQRGMLTRCKKKRRKKQPFGKIYF